MSYDRVHIIFMPSCGPEIWTAGAASDSDDERMSTMAQARAIGDCAFAELGFQESCFLVATWQHANLHIERC